jgi:hypothetical protein
MGEQRGNRFQWVMMQTAKELAIELGLDQTLTVSKVFSFRYVLDLL